MAKIVKVINLFSETSATTTSTTAVVASTGDATGHYWDADAYNGTVAVYFEAVLKSSNGSNAYARLTNTSGTLVTSSEVTTTSTTTQVVRSGDISANLTDNTSYIVGIRSASGVTTTLYAARLVVIQTGGITKTETQIPLCGQLVATTSTAIIDHTFTYRFFYDASKYDGTVSIFFEAGCRSTGAGIAATAYLYDTSSNQITSVSVTGTNGARTRSGAITLTDGTTYIARIRSANALFNAQIGSCKIIIQQTGFTKTETHYPLRTAQLTASATSDTSLDGLITWTASEWFVATNTIYYEATLLISGANTAYLDLNDGSSDIITLSTTSTTKTRVRSNSAVTLANATNYNPQLRASAAVTSTAVGPRLIIHSQLQNAPFHGSDF